MKTFPFFTNLFLVVTVVSCMTPRGPEQIHISFGHTPDKMYVMWSMSQPSVTNVTYSPIPTTLELLAIPKCWQFTKGNPSGLQYLCRAELVSRRSWYCAIINCVWMGGCPRVCLCIISQDMVTPGAMHYYYIHCEWGSSPPLNFTAMRSGQVCTYHVMNYVL